MNLFKTIMRIKPIGLWNLIKLAVPNLLYLWPTYCATKACMQLSTAHFGRKHYQNGQANAFRHALWNVLIARACLKGRNGFERALNWTRKITDWHEDTFFSKSLPMKMDYHNNAVGRWLFETNTNWTREQLITALLALADKAVQITKESKLELYKNQLVYITDDH